MTEQEIFNLGRDLAEQTRWTGSTILEICAEALTEANFHHESEIVKQMAQAIEEMDDNPQFKLEILNKGIPFD